MRPPLLVVGAARSGTTLVGERLLGSHANVLYWSEPEFVWRYGNAYKLHDMLTVEHCGPGIQRRIRSAFERKASERPQSLLVEKTPANSYRMPFVLTVLPEARVLHVVRDGRQVARSARNEWVGRGAGALDSVSLRRLGISRRLAAILRRDLRLGERCVGPLSPFELPAYAPRALSLLLRQILHVSWLPWGPRFPGILMARWRFGPLGVAALQWKLSVELTRNACARLGPERYREITFEDLQTCPESTLRIIGEFADLDGREEWIQRCLALLKPRPIEPGAGLKEREIEQIERLVRQTLAECGYPLLSEPPADWTAAESFRA